MNSPGRRLPPAAAVLVLLFGSAFALLQPLLYGPDEAAHYFRSFQISQGVLTPQTTGTSGGVQMYGGQVPKAAITLASNGTGRQWSAPKRTAVHQPNAARDAAQSAPAVGPLAQAAFPNSAAYAPPSYAPAVVGQWVGQALHLDLGRTMLAMRLAGVLTYAGAVALVLWVLRHWRVRWLALPVLLLPTAVFQASCITADTMTSAVCLVLCALVVRAAFLRAPLTTAQTWLLVACAVLAPVIKPTYAVLVLLLLVVPPAALTWRRAAIDPAAPVEPGWRGRTPGVVALGATGLVAAALTLLWLRLSSGTTAAMGIVRGPGQEHLVRPDDQLRLLLEQPGRTALVALRTLTDPMERIVPEYFSQTGYQVQGSILAVPLLLGALALGIGVAERWARSVPRAVVSWAALIGSAVAVVAALALSFTPVGTWYVSGIQGRYFVPLGLLGAVLVAGLVPFRLGDDDAPRVGRWVLGLVLAALLLTVTKYGLLMWTDAATQLS